MRQFPLHQNRHQFHNPLLSDYFQAVVAQWASKTTESEQGKRELRIG